MQIKSFAVAPIAALILSACVAQTGNNVAVLQGPPVQEVITPYDIALTCLRTKMSEQNITPAFVAIGQIADRTGRSLYNEGETVNVTQGAGDMVSSAVQTNGIAFLVERLDTRILAFEQAQAMKKILGDGKTSEVRGADGLARLVAYRPIALGSLQGSQFYMVGSISSLDWAVSSAGGDVSIAGIGPRARQGRGLVALDIRIVDTKSGRVVAAKSLSKQLVAEEVGVGVGRFFGTTLVNIDIGGNRSTPLNLMLRSMLNLAVFETMSEVYSVDVSTCRTELDKTETAAAAS